MAMAIPLFKADINNSSVICIIIIINYEGGSGDHDNVCLKVMGMQRCLQDMIPFPSFIVCINSTNLQLAT